MRKRSRVLFWAVAVFSFFANLLMLSGPIYMLQIYDRVLTSGSYETLVALSVLVLFLYTVMGVLDLVRQRVMARVGLRFYQGLSRRVFDATLRKAAVLPDKRSEGALDDLGKLRQIYGAPVVGACFDLPWTPFFFAVIFLFHPVLGFAAIAGALALVTIACANQLLSRRSQLDGTVQTQLAQTTMRQLHEQAGFVRASGMREAGFMLWQKRQITAIGYQSKANGIGSGLTTLTKTIRLILQSAMLGLGAWLVIGGQMTAGGMIAGSILLGRALSPMETVLNQWSSVQEARQSWERLTELLGEVRAEEARTELPAPRAILEIKGLTVVPPGERQATLKSLSFSVEPGQALGVVGPSGSGKSSLARALVGLWPSVGGLIRLDAAAIELYGPDILGKHLGYLPQQVVLFDGTIAQNIAQMAEVPQDERVVAATKLAGAHEMVLSLPQGYDTPIDAGNLRLSGGQLQLLGLARALYEDPVVVVLDEPNANLDNDGSIALNAAVETLKARGRAVVIMAHRPAAIKQCDMLLVLDAGMRMAFGPKEQVLAGMVTNARAISQKPSAMAGIK